ncbi:MAG: 5-(carboxyamino)imidazole ribonucleotide synthase [Burkholderia sp.]|nr:5-(carboxyamino)imidazole ribonucleotide synthase [Burkholderia sp.]
MITTSSSNSPILPGAWLGMIGGGQLARMFCFSAQSMGYRVAVLDPNPTSVAGAVAERHFRAEYDDKTALIELSSLCNAISIEFENIPASSINLLAHRTFVTPTSRCIAIAQNRISEKRYIESAGVQVAPYIVIESIEDLAALNNNQIDSMLPGILKTARLGYDGKGQVYVRFACEMREAYASIGSVPCILEKMVPIKYEVSALITRSIDGKSAIFPISQNIYHHRILSMAIIPAPLVNDVLIVQIKKITTKIADRLNYIGVLCVEFFVLEDDSLVVNEIAPRPHNSGHYTIDACVTSQFEQQVRTMTRMPIGNPLQNSFAVMLNILGDIWFSDKSSGIDNISIDVNQAAFIPPWDKVMEIPTAHLHLYGKQDVRVGRKMGHINFTASTLDEVVSAATSCANLLNLNDIHSVFLTNLV